ETEEAPRQLWGEAKLRIDHRGGPIYIQRNPPGSSYLQEAFDCTGNAAKTTGDFTPFSRLIYQRQKRLGPRINGMKAVAKTGEVATMLFSPGRYPLCRRIGKTQTCILESGYVAIELDSLLACASMDIAKGINTGRE